MGRRIGTVKRPAALRGTVVYTCTVAGLEPFNPLEVQDAVDEVAEDGKTAVVVVYAWELADDTS
jgi:hypothetical protein